MQPSQLLLAQHRIVPFTGRDEQLAGLVAWRDAPDGPRVAVRLLHGPGGRGKTRLALELAEKSGSDWQVWQAAEGAAGPAMPVGGRPRSLGSRALIIVDYAERWPAGSLAFLLRDVASQPGERRRVLLVARSAGTWWLSLRHELHKLGYDITVTLLDQLRDTAERGIEALSDRQQAFLAARDSFAEALGLPAPEAAGQPGNLHDQAFGLTLTIHMAALVAVDAQIRGKQPPTDPEALSAYLLDRERAFWEKLHAGGTGRVELDADAMAQVVYAATLTGSLPNAAALSALEIAHIESGIVPGKILKHHAVAYPSATSDRFLEPLYPDRLGEDFIALTTPGHDRPDPSDPWATAALTRLLTMREDGSAPGWTRHALTVVIETVRRWDHIASGYLYPLLRRQPRLALAAGGAALAALSSLPKIDFGVLEAIAAEFPQRDIDLNAGMAALTKRLGDHLLEAENDPAKRAWIYNDISSRMSLAGLHQLGVEPARQAVDLYRSLLRSDPALHQEALARALDALGIHLNYSDHDEESLAVTQESVDIFRKLVDSGRSDLMPTLGRVLANLSARERLTPDQRLRTAGEAVAIGRRCQAENPNAEELELAGALENLAFALQDHACVEDAVVAFREALAIRRSQARRAPEAFSPDLARVLNNLGDLLYRTGELADSIAVTTEAIDVNRRVVAADPSYGQRRLADSLFRLGYEKIEAEQYEDAAVTCEEAADVYRQMETAEPGSWAGKLAACLTNLGVAYRRTGDANKALAATSEAVRHYRVLAQADPASYESGLARALGNFASQAADADRHDDAVATDTEAVGLYRRLAAADPSMQPALASSLYRLGCRMAEAGQTQTAVPFLAEASELFRALAEAEPASYEESLATCLYVLGTLYADVGNPDKALTVTNEAVSRYRQLAASDPDSFETLLDEATEFLDSLRHETGEKH